MLERVREFVKEYDMLEPGDRVIAAVSGGADSVCLLSVLARIALELPVSLRVVHVHHGLRGAEADRDEAYVRELCGRLQAPFAAVHRDVAAYAAERGLSTEEAGRILRYEALEAAAEAWDAEAGAGVESEKDAEAGAREGAAEAAKAAEPERDAAYRAQITHRTKIAVAHHQEDSAETILHNLLRGSGLKGLSGIQPVQGRRIRPLLCVGRKEILDYLGAEKLDWCEDSTNASGDYTRNRIRGQLLPMMTELVNVRAVENILRAGTVFAQADRYIESRAGNVWDQSGTVVREPEREAKAVSAQIPLDVFRQQEDIIQTYLVRRMLDEVTPGWKDITHRHFRQISELAYRQVGSRLDLPGAMVAEVGYEVLQVRRRAKIVQHEAAGEGQNPEIMKMSIFSRQKGMEIPKNQYTKWFDYDKIKGMLSVRSRQEGDYLVLPDGGRKPVARYMIDEKIPRQQRGEIPVLAEGSHVLWVAGYRISEYYKITDNTKTILQVTYDGGENHGR